MDPDETLIQYGKSLGEELCIKERIWYRERFGFKLQFKANGLNKYISVISVIMHGSEWKFNTIQ